jgi:hypothetical protein
MYIRVKRRRKIRSLNSHPLPIDHLPDIDPPEFKIIWKILIIDPVEGFNTVLCDINNPDLEGAWATSVLKSLLRKSQQQ